MGKYVFLQLDVWTAAAKTTKTFFNKIPSRSQEIDVNQHCLFNIKVLNYMQCSFTELTPHVHQISSNMDFTIIDSKAAAAIIVMATATQGKHSRATQGTLKGIVVKNFTDSKKYIKFEWTDKI